MKPTCKICLLVVKVFLRKREKELMVARKDNKATKSGENKAILFHLYNVLSW